MWYLLDAEPEAGLIMGFKHDTTKEEYLGRLHNNTLPELLNTEKVKKETAFLYRQVLSMPSVKVALLPKSSRHQTLLIVFTITTDAIKTEIPGNYTPNWPQM